MIALNKFIIIFPLLVPQVVVEKDRIIETHSYETLSQQQPNFKSPMEYNTMTMEELKEENNQKLIQQIYKNLE